MVITTRAKHVQINLSFVCISHILFNIMCHVCFGFIGVFHNFPLVEQELLSLPEHLSSSPVFSGVRVTRCLVFCVCFVDRCLAFGLFLLAIVLSVLLPFTDSDYPFGIIWPLCCLFFFDLRLLITPLVSFGHCVVCSTSIYGF